MVNTGDIYVRYAEKFGADVAVGGIAGNTAQLISNATANCSIAAIGFNESAETPICGVGMITGSHRLLTKLVDKCKVAGRYALEEKDGQPNWITLVHAVEELDEETGTTENLENDNAKAFWRKIYGGKGAEASATNCDNCSYAK